ncbi:heavy metal-associated isoprenylated plant protein 23-like [Spinacia oleracea]|uniref:Heavy metal-associated isoprenylated plant protein 23-like n=1 Tax=Spinacia oleracea TaxID=3562 RepID=A0A9R0IL51_SPIOL|nr:heavy metal-associated isoprenylated plant protein 23-like [Spinacia oleracea]
MGVGGGTLEFISEMMGSGRRHIHNKKNRKQFQTIELKVRMDCDGCELKVRKALSSLSGVKKVEINRKQQKVTVSGYVEANKVLKKAKSTGKKAEIWPYVPYNLVSQAC